MSRYVQVGKHIFPASMFEPDLKPPPGACKQCGGRGSLVETIDSERFDVLVPCWSCQTFCKTCNRYVKKGGHECKGAKA
jgi:hypothetical protein